MEWKRKIGLVTVMLLVLLLDRFTKAWISQQLALGESQPIISGIVSLTLVHNPGAAFGLLAGRRWLFVLAVLVLIVLLLVYRKVLAEQATLSQYAIALLMGGVFGNLWDRVMLGYVVDFLDFHVWPVFNVADAAIVCGALVLGWEVVRNERRTRPK